MGGKTGWGRWPLLWLGLQCASTVWAGNPDGAGMIGFSVAGDSDRSIAKGALKIGTSTESFGAEETSNWSTSTYLLAPLTQSLELGASAGYSRGDNDFSISYDNPVIGNMGRFLEWNDSQQRWESLTLNWFPSVQFKGPWGEATPPNPDGWCWWPRLNSWINRSDNVSRYGYPVRTRSFRFVSSTDNEDIGWYCGGNITLPVADWLSVWGNYLYGIQDDWQSGPYTGVTRHGWEGYNLGVSAYVHLFRSDGPYFPRVGRPGSVRLDLNTYWENRLWQGVASQSNIVVGADFVLDRHLALNLSWQRTRQYQGQLDGVYKIRMSQDDLMTQSLAAAVEIGFGAD
jgi:hypothetical protein